MIGTKEYKAQLGLTVIASDGSTIDQNITVVVQGDSKEQVEARLKNARASVTLRDVKITSVHHVGRKRFNLDE